MRGRAAGVRERGQCAAGVRERGQCARAESGKSERITSSYIERDNRIACTFTSDERSKMWERRERTSVHAKHKGRDSCNTKGGARVRYIQYTLNGLADLGGLAGSKGRGRDS